MAVVSSCPGMWHLVAQRTQSIQFRASSLSGRSSPLIIHTRVVHADKPYISNELSAYVEEVKSIWPISIGLHTCHKG